MRFFVYESMSEFPDFPSKNFQLALAAMAQTWVLVDAPTNVAIHGIDPSMWGEKFNSPHQVMRVALKCQMLGIQLGIETWLKR